MIYAFCFLGEFGYELFNWQGLVRKFALNRNPDDKIVVCGRKGLDIWYENADLFVDISLEQVYRGSIASMYTAHRDDDYPYDFEDELKASLDEFITTKISERYGKDENIRFIFSCDKNMIDDIKFGPWEETLSIYEGNGYTQNKYKKISPNLMKVKKGIEDKLGFSLDQPYILVQKRTREIVIRSKSYIEETPILDALGTIAPVILLDFDTGRLNDSKSKFSNDLDINFYKCDSAHDQAVLIANADACVFLTEGDFGSHIYIPPFMGKDVFAIAPRDIYEIGTTPIDFWNKKIFCFGGQIIPYESEALANPKKLKEFVTFLSKRISALRLFLKVEENSKNMDCSALYLWPRTPKTPNHQDKIFERVGARDYDVENPLSRSNSIIRHIRRLVHEGKLSRQFVLADLCGGDAVVGLEIKKAFPESEIIVQDCMKDTFDTHVIAKSVGTRIYGGYLQEIVKHNFDCPIDFVMMLNTYRGWANADLHENEQDLPSLVDDWMDRNAQFIIVTATLAQIMDLKKKGRNLKIIGKGEDDSHMICIKTSRS